MDPIKDTQKFTFGLEARDAKDQPTTLPAGATVSWASSNPNVASVATNADGISGDVVAGLPGVTTISVVVTNPDGTTAAGASDVTVVSGAEAKIALLPGPVSEQ